MLLTQSLPKPCLWNPQPQPGAMLYTQSHCPNPNLKPPTTALNNALHTITLPKPKPETPNHSLKQCSTHSHTAQTQTWNPQPQPGAMLYTQSHCPNPTLETPNHSLKQCSTHNHLHTTVCIQSFCPNPTLVIPNQQCSAHNHLHTTVCIQSFCPNPTLVIPNQQCSAHNHLHTIIPALGLKDTMASWDWGARRECRHWQPLGSCQPQKKSCNQCTCLWKGKAECCTAVTS